MNSISIELPPSTETRLRERAASTGANFNKYLVQLLVRQSADSPEKNREDQLVSMASQGLPIAVWMRYNSLVDKRKLGVLTETEHEELMLLTDEVEVAHYKRLGHLAELSKIRKTTLEQLMSEFGIPVHNYD